VFLPLHALVTERGWGIGDLSGLGELSDLVRGLGGGIVATLPLLAGFAGEASPYRPVSRLFWNEVYVDVTAIRIDRVGAVRRLVRSAGFERELAAVRSGELVAHGRVLSLKRRALERFATALDGEHAKDLARFRRLRPDLETYARFRAAGERFGADWRAWPVRARAGSISPADVDPDAVAYHRVAQWVAEEQVRDLGERSSRGGPGLYLDMPLGVHPDGFDVWRHRSAFAHGVSVGAPPDDFFPAGQDWHLPCTSAFARTATYPIASCATRSVRGYPSGSRDRAAPPAPLLQGRRRTAGCSSAIVQEWYGDLDRGVPERHGGGREDPARSDRDPLGDAPTPPPPSHVLELETVPSGGRWCGTFGVVLATLNTTTCRRSRRSGAATTSRRLEDGFLTRLVRTGTGAPR
jgi:hypothetical protein